MTNPEIRINANDPCSNANSSLPVPCNASTAWRLGPYYIAALVYWSPTSYIVTASQPGMVVVLTDGEPYEGGTSYTYPAYLSFAVSGSVDNVTPVRFVITAQTYALTYYISQCSFSTCTNTTAYPGPNSPPGVVQITGTVLKQTTATIMITNTDIGYCDPTLDSNGCLYFISIYPPVACSGETCGAAYTIIGTIVQSGNPINIPWNMIANSVYTVNGIVNSPSSMSTSSPLSESSANPGTAVEIYLSPFTTGAVDVRLTLDACGPVTYNSGTNQWQGFPALYVCDPSISGPLGCTNPYLPGPGSQSNTISGSTATANGRVVLSISQTTASILYMSILDSIISSTSIQNIQGTLPILSPSFALSVSAYSNTPYLVAGNGASTVRVSYLSSSHESATSGTSVENVRISWDPAQIVVYDQSMPNITAIGVTYTIYFAANGFTSSYVPQTVCGIQNWAALVSPSTSNVITTSNTTYIDVYGLSSLTGEFQVNVVATCDSTCWMLTYPTMYQNLSSLQPQQAIYILTTFNASQSNPSSNNIPSNSTVIIIGSSVGIGSLLLLCCIMGSIWYQRKHGRFCCSCCQRTSIPGNAGLLVIAEDEKDYMLQQQSSNSHQSTPMFGSSSTKRASPLPSSSPVYPVGRDVRVAQLRESIGSTPNFSAKNTPYMGSSTMPNLSLSPPLLSLNQTRNELNINNNRNTYVPPTTPPLMSLGER